MAVNVNSCRLTGCVVSLCGGVVADQRYNDTGVANLIFNVLHVDWIRERLDGGSSLRVLVFWLDKDDRAALSDLRRLDLRQHILHVVVGRFQEIGSARSQCAVNPLNPSGETSTRYFSIDVRSRSSKEIDASLLRSVEERL